MEDPLEARIAPATPASGGVRRSLSHWLFTPAGVLCVVAVAYALAQVVLFDESRFLEWDEAVYIGRATDRFASPGWAAHRALGVPWLLMPVFLVSSSFRLMRWYLVATSTVAVALAFATWLKTIGYRAPLAMALFASTWVALIYGSEASPNLYVAACAVGAAGSLMRVHEQRGRRWLAATAAFVALTVHFRPSDGLVVAGSLFVVSLVVASRRMRIQAAGAVVIGAAVGMIPWAIDAYNHFGGPLERWRNASSIVGSNLQSHVVTHLRLLDGPLQGPDPGGGLPATFIAIVVVGIALAVTAAVVSQPRLPVLVAGSLAIVMVLPYLFFVGSSAPRFLLPAYAFGSLAVAAGIAEVARRWPDVMVVLAALVSVAVAASLAQATRFHDQQYLERRDVLEVGTAVAQFADAEPCISLAQYGVPQVVITSGCQGLRLVVAEASCQIASLPDQGTTVIVSLIGPPPPDLQAAAAGDAVTIRDRWTVLRVDRDLVRCEPESADDGQ